MIGAVTLARGLWHRVGTSIVILVVSLCATAAAAIGPVYYAAARDSILQDALTTPDVVTRGFQTTQSGGLSGSLDAFSQRVDDQVRTALGGGAEEQRLFQPPIRALEHQVFFREKAQTASLVWRSDVCVHLRLRSGQCPTQRNEILISTKMAADYHWQLGQTVKAQNHPAFKIVGTYRLPNTRLDYWYGRGSTYFPSEEPKPGTPAGPSAIFTPRSTIESLKHNPQGSLVVVQVLNVPHVTPGDVDRINAMANGLQNSPSLLNAQVVVTTGLPATIDDVHASWSALAVPVLVVTAELLVLTWLLLFLVVTDAVEARGTEIALAKLRGYGAARAMVFGLGEPAVLLLVALPLGALLGWALTAALTGVLLRDGTPVPLPALGWAAAAVAVLGGAAAIVVAGRRTVVRPVVDQWRRTGRKANDRAWVFDAVVLTAAVAGLAELFGSGTLSSSSQSSLALLVPGLLGLAIAVVASRLLPAICRSMFGRTRSKGDLGAFLAVRHIARRPGGTRTTMILATAVALATFSMAAWIVGDANRSRIAQIGVGAPTVLTVSPPLGTDLGRVVDRIDPDGHTAAAVETFDNGSTVLVAVQPQRFARVAHWTAGGVTDATTLLADLHPPAPDSIVLTGDRMRVRLRDAVVHPQQVAAVADIAAAGSSAPTPVELGTFHAGPAPTLEGDLASCPCILKDIQISPPGGGAGQVNGRVTIAGIDQHTKTGWTRVSETAAAGQWADTVDQQVSLRPGPDGLQWQFFAAGSAPATLQVVDRPDPMPAVVSKALVKPDTAIAVSGLNAIQLGVSPTGTAPGVPGAAFNGVVVDLDYALRAATDDTDPATAQVWVRGDAEKVRHDLVAAGVPVVASASSADVADQLGRQGPGLASVLFLTDAAAAAVLAALAAVLSLSAAARRRRYEYAALAAAGAPRKSLYRALAIEQIAVIGFGALTGVVAGLLASGIAGRSVPEFVHPPSSPLLSYLPSPLFMGLVIGFGLIVLMSVAAAAASALLRSVTPEQLREAPL